MERGLKVVLVFSLKTGVRAANLSVRKGYDH